MLPLTSLRKRALGEGVGNTPLIELEKFGEGNSRLYAKLEWLNQWGSVKDRAAYWMIRGAEERGLISRDTHIIIEPTSGNMGIALAGLARGLAYEVTLVVPDKVSEETKRLLKEMGSEVIETWDDLCPRVGPGTDQSISLTTSMVASNPKRNKDGLKEFFMPNQYQNEDNFRAHYESTGPELWEQTSGRVTHFITGIGTGGTVSGVGAFLRERNSSIKIVAVEPQKSHHIQGLRNLEESAMPALLERHKDVVDGWMRVTDDEAFNAARLLASKENLYVGPSSGAVMAVALKISQSAQEGQIVMVFADSGRKFDSVYKSLGVFTDDEIAHLSKAARYLNGG